MTQETNYSEAYQELEQIVKDLESDHVSIDILTEKLKRASVLIHICKNKLKATETEVQEIMENL